MPDVMECPDRQFRGPWAFHFYFYSLFCFQISLRISKIGFETFFTHHISISFIFIFRSFSFSFSCSFFFSFSSSFSSPPFLFLLHFRFRFRFLVFHVHFDFHFHSFSFPPLFFFCIFDFDLDFDLDFDFGFSCSFSISISISFLFSFSFLAQREENSGEISRDFRRILATRPGAFERWRRLISNAPGRVPTRVKSGEIWRDFTRFSPDFRRKFAPAEWRQGCGWC